MLGTWSHQREITVRNTLTIMDHKHYAWTDNLIQIGEGTDYTWRPEDAVVSTGLWMYGTRKRVVSAVSIAPSGTS